MIFLKILLIFLAYFKDFRTFVMSKDDKTGESENLEKSRKNENPKAL